MFYVDWTIIRKALKYWIVFIYQSIVTLTFFEPVPYKNEFICCYHVCVY